MNPTKPQTLTIRIGPAQRKLWEEYAEAREMRLGEFVRYAVRVYTDSTTKEES